MRIILPVLVCVLAMVNTRGQVHSVQIGPGDTTICQGSSIRLWTSFSIGSFRYIGTYGGKDYFMDTISRSWSNARTAAQARGLDLWVVETQNENNAVYNFIPRKDLPNTLFWIGLFQDPAAEAQSGPTAGWKWVNGKNLDPAGFVNWSAGEPDNKFQAADGANVAGLGLIPNGSRWMDATDNPGVSYQGFAIAEIDASSIITIWNNNQTHPQFIDVKPEQNTRYSVSVEYRGELAISKTIMVSVSAPQSSALFEVDGSSNTCLGKNRFVFTNLTTASATTTYAWDFGDGNRSAQPSPTHSFSGAQTYTVKLTAFDHLGCNTSFSRNVVVRSSPLIPVISHASKNRTFCEGDSLSLTSVVVQPDPQVSYRWYFNGSQVGSTKSFAAKFSGSYLLEATNANGCRDSATITLAATKRPDKPRLSIPAGFSASFCEQDSTRIRADQAGAQLKYNWVREMNAELKEVTGQHSAALTVHTPFALAEVPVFLKYYLSVLDENGCVSEISDPIEVTVNPSPLAQLSAKGAPTTFCNGDSVKIWASTNFDKSTYTWIRDNEVLGSGKDSVFSAKKTGAYTVKVTNLYACASNSAPLNIIAHQFPDAPVLQPDPGAPEVTAQGDVNICQGSSTTLRVSPLDGARYQWFRDGVKLNGETIEKISIKTPGKYKVTVALFGCATTSRETAVGYLPAPAGQLEQPVAPVICDGSSFTLKASGAVAYQWYFNYNIIQGARSATYSTMIPGVYQVEYTSDKGCKALSSDFVNLSLIRKPVVRFTLDVYCTGTPAQFSNQSQTSRSGSVTYLWNFQHAKQSTLENPIYQFPAAGLYKVTLAVTPNACPQLADSSSLNIQIEAAPPGIKYPPINSMVGRSISLVARSIGDFYEWKPATGLNSQYIRVPLLNTPAKEQVYTVDITTRSGCRTVDTQLVRIFDEQEVYVPKGFTPNGDRNNDRVYPILVGVAVFRSIKIFNRWGILVFQTAATDPEQGWDGTYKGEPQPPGTYTWVVDAVGDNGRDIRRSGTITLIR